MRKIFSFKGISWNGDDMLSSEGECLDVVNMRMKDGAFVPLPEPGNVAVLDKRYSRIFWHEMASCYICVTDDADATLHVYDKEWKAMRGKDGGLMLFDALRGVSNVEFQGFIVCCIADKGVFYLLFNDGVYKWLGERPPMPSLEITARSALQRIITTEKYHTLPSGDIESSWQYNSKGYFDECIAVQNKNGCFIDRALFRFALRLYDGSYTCLSPVLYVSDEGCINAVARDSRNLHSEANTDESLSTYDVSVLGFKPEFRFSGIDLEGWESIVMGIDLFTTGSIMGKHVAEKNATFRGSGSLEYKRFEVYKNKTLTELWNDIFSASHFYKIAEYDIHGNLLEKVDDVSAVNLALQHSLAAENSSLNTFSAGCSCMFNGRLHVGSLREWFFNGYPSFFLNSAYGEKSMMESMYVETKIRGNGGTSRVVKRYDNVPLAFNYGFFELPPMLSYPDSRAFEMTVYLYVDTELFCRTFELVPHRNLNLALYINKWYLGLEVKSKASLSNGVRLADMADKDVVGMFSFVEGEHTVVFDKSGDRWRYNGMDFPPERYSSVRMVSNVGALADGDSITFTLTRCADEDSYGEICNIIVDDSWTLLGGGVDENCINPYEDRKNVLKVSAPGNPFLFPAECTYSPSQGEVVAIASNTVALSQGQFGQHPLYLFCSDGIWAMTVDTSGSMAYLSSFPLSREACVNSNAVCGVDNGVVFVSERGAVLATGGKMVHVSNCMENFPPVLHTLYSGGPVLKIASMMRMPEVMNVHGFHDFLSGACTAYLPEYAEVMFANGRYGCCYIYSIKDGCWSRMLINVKGFIRSYSFLELFAGDETSTRIFRIANGNSGGNTVMLLTRPLLWGTKLPKRILQLMLHAYARPCAGKSMRVPSLACYMLGSNDGVHFKILAGRECEEEVKDLKFPYFPTQAYKYYIFAVCGELSAGSMVTALELEVQPAWGNRMR